MGETLAMNNINKLGKLGIGPMSSEVIEAVFRFSEERKESLMLIASKNQIDWDKGYVNNWKTEEYGNYLKQMKLKYPSSSVLVCRDHCGPGFKNNDLKDVYKTIDSDLANNFDLIHIDFCHSPVSHNELLNQSSEAIDYVLKSAPQTLIEVGTDENTGVFSENLNKIELEMSFFTSRFPIAFFVSQTGTVVKEIYQAGAFNASYVANVRKLADKYSLRLKEHNCDYIPLSQMKLRHGLIDAVNVAPQYGVMQTLLLLQKASTYGLDATEFLETSYASRKWEKWLKSNTSQNKYLCAVIAGHYVFASDSYKRLVEKINLHEDFAEVVINEMMKNFSLYISSI